MKELKKATNNCHDEADHISQTLEGLKKECLQQVSIDNVVFCEMCLNLSSSFKIHDPVLIQPCLLKGKDELQLNYDGP